MTSEVEEEIRHLIDSNYKKLTKEEEIEAWENGDHTKLLNSQLRVIYKVAHQVVTVAQRPDLLSDAFAISYTEAMGIIVKSFNPERARLITLMMIALKNRVFRGLQTFRDDGGLKRWRHDGKSIVETGCKACTFTDISAERDERDEFQPAWDDDLSIVDRQDELEKIYNAKSLTNAEADVLHMRYRCDIGLREIGQLMGVTKSRVQQIQENALRKVREELGLDPDKIKRDIKQGNENAKRRRKEAGSSKVRAR